MILPISESHKIDFKAYGLHRDHPPAWELRIKTLIIKTFQSIVLRILTKTDSRKHTP